MNEIKYEAKYYSLGGFCVKREGDLTTKEVRLPEGKHLLPLSYVPGLYPSKQHLDDLVATMEPVDQEFWEKTILTFCGRVEFGISVPLTEHRLAKEKQKLNHQKK